MRIRAHRDGLVEAPEAEDDPDLRALADAANATPTVEETAHAVGAGVSANAGAVRRGELTGIIESDENRRGRRRVPRVYRREIERWSAAHAGQTEHKPRRVRSA